MSTSKDLSSLVDSLQAKAAAKPAKAAIYQAKLDTKIASLIAKGKTVIIDGATVTSYDLDTGSSGDGSSDGGSSGSTTGSTFTLGTGADILSPNAAETKYQTTSNDDSIYARTANSLNGGDVLDGGAGSDAIFADIDTGTAANLTIAPTLSNIETIQIEGSSATMTKDFTISLANSSGYDVVSFKGMTGTGGNGHTASNLLSGVEGTVDSNGVNTNDYTFSLKSGQASTTADTFTLNVTANTTAVDVLTVTDATATATADTGVETLVINSTGTGTSAASTIATLTVSDSAASSLNKITVNATSALTVTGAIDFEGTNGAGTIDASASTANVKFSDAADTEDGNLTFTGGSGNDTVVSGDGNDVLAGGAGKDSITAGAGNDSISGGEGNDEVVFGAIANLTGADTVDGGDGTDYLSFSDVDIVSSTDISSDAKALINATSGFEGLTLSAADVYSINYDYLASGFTDVKLTGAVVDSANGNLLVTNVRTNDRLIFTADAEGVTGAGFVQLTGVLPGQTFRVDLSGTGVEVEGDDDTTATTNHAIDVIGNISTLLIDSTATTADDTADNSINATSAGAFAIDNGSAQNVVVTGNQDLQIIGSATTEEGFGSGVAVVASAFTANLTISLSADADTITLGTGTANTVRGFAGADQITGNAGKDTIYGGAGNDTISGAEGNDSIQGGADTDSMTGGSGVDTFDFDDLDGADADTAFTSAGDTITDFVSGTDKLNFNAAGTASNYAENTTAAASFGALLTAAGSSNNGTLLYYFGVYGSDGYLVFDLTGEDAATATLVIKLAGVTDLAYTDIV